MGAGYAANRQASAAKNATKNTSTSDMPAWQREQFLRAYDATNFAANRPTADAVAGFNDTQRSAFGAVTANQGLGYEDMDAAIAAQKGLNAGATYTDVDLAKYQDPYQQQVINAALDDLWTLRNRGNAQIASQAEAAGAWGGDRAVVAQSLNNESMDRTAASTLANLRSQGFTTAAQLAQSDAAMRNNFSLSNLGMQMTGNAQLQALIDARRSAANTDASNLLAVGNQQQAQSQAEMDWAIKRAELMSNVASQSGYGGTTTSTTTGASPDKWASTLQGLNSGLQLGRSIYDLFGGGKSPVDYVSLSPDIKKI